MRHTKMRTAWLCTAVFICFAIWHCDAGRSGYTSSNPSLYLNSTILNSGLTVSWTVDSDGWIHFLFEAPTTGWFGFGIPEPTVGTMPGSDIMVAWVDDYSGSVTVQDMWADAFAPPNVDQCADWLLDDGYQNTSFTVVAVSRLLDTGDNSDRVIGLGPTKIVWSHNADGSDGLSYHGPNRFTDAITFILDPVLDDLLNIDPTWQHMDLQMPDFNVPNEVTTYACFSFNVTQSVDHHIVRIDPILSNATGVLIHHFLLHNCESTGDWPKFNTTAQQCISPLNPTSGCSSPIYGWGLGGGPLVLPSQAGYRIGTNADPDGFSMRYFILEVHYNSPNPYSPTFRADNSGVRIWYTNQTRQYDAGMMVLGDPFVSQSPINPDTITEIQISCQSGCTSLWGQSINVFADFLHMHTIGMRQWSTVHRGGTQLPGYLNRIEFYDFSFQTFYPKEPYYVLQPGDAIETHCMYNSYSRTNLTTFGITSQNEMCMEFIAYFPLVHDPANGKPWAVCGSLHFQQGQEIIPGVTDITLCGSLQESALYTHYSQLPAYSITVDSPGGDKAEFGSANSQGWCPDPTTGKLVSPPPSNGPPTNSPDPEVIVWSSVGGGFILLCVVVAIWMHTKRTSLAPQRLDQMDS